MEDRPIVERRGDAAARLDANDDGSHAEDSASMWSPGCDQPDTTGARLRLRIFGIDEDQTSFERRGFTALDDHARERLELVGRWFIRGYRAALVELDPNLLAARLNQCAPADFRGFAYEGAATALTVLDAMLPTKRRLRRFLRGAGFPYAWMLPVGYGWARMMMRRPPRRPPGLFDPLQAWIAIDGAGFCEGFNKPERAFERQQVPRRLTPQAAQVFDQGLGRSLWFVRGADVQRIAATIDAFPQRRSGNLWSGTASAATYAGGVGEGQLMTLREAAGKHRLDVAVGAALAAKARLLGGNLTGHTEQACRVLCGTDTVTAARCTDIALEGIALDGANSPYEAWRARTGELLQAL